MEIEDVEKAMQYLDEIASIRLKADGDLGYVELGWLYGYQINAIREVLEEAMRYARIQTKKHRAS